MRLIKSGDETGGCRTGKHFPAVDRAIIRHAVLPRIQHEVRCRL
jgi:hypothetical protein